jgi:hypothetical protein
VSKILPSLDTGSDAAGFHSPKPRIGARRDDVAAKPSAVPATKPSVPATKAKRNLRGMVLTSFPTDKT